MRGWPFFAIALVLPIPLAWGVPALAPAHAAPHGGVDVTAAALAPLATTPSVAANVRVTTTSGPANEVMLAIDPTNAQHIIATAKDYTLTASSPQRCSVNRVWGGLYVSFDGGATWTNGHFPGALPSDPMTAASGFDCMSDPVVAFAPDGTVTFTGLLEGKHVAPGVSCPVLSSGDCTVAYGLLFATSRDGLSWSHDQIVWIGTSSVSGNVNTWADKNWQAVDPSDPHNVYISWDLITETDTPMLSRSLDGGATWITTPLPAVSASLPSTAVDTDGTLYVAWNGACSQPHTTPVSTTCAVVATSIDHGATFTLADAGVEAASVIVMPYRTVTSPYVTAAGHGQVAVAWSDGQYIPSTASYRGRVQVARSTDGGATFARTTLVDDASSHQVMPQVAISKSGTVGVLYDQDDGTSTHHITARFQAAPSLTAPFGAPVSASSTSFTPWASYHQEGFVFMGDYLGLAADANGVFHAAWADTRNGRADVYATTITP